LRRDNADMVALPQKEIFYSCRMRRASALRKPPMKRAGALRAEIEMLSLVSPVV
jgi:hypothetical protein